MDFVDHYPPYGTEVFAHPLTRQNGLQGFRGGDQHVRRVKRLFSSSVLGCISMSNLNLDAQSFPCFDETSENIAVQSAKRRDVEDGYAIERMF